MSTIIDLLIQYPLLELFLIAAMGYPLGKIRFFGTSLGVATVLFVGMGFGALHPRLVLPDIVFVLGLVLFVYTIGLSSGKTFFASFRRKGIRDNLFVAGTLAVGVAAAWFVSRLFHLPSTLRAGVFAGGLTNTPALAGILDTVRGSAPADQVGRALGEPVVAYSIAYPMGVLGVMLAIVTVQRVCKIDYAAEARCVKGFALEGQEILRRTVRVTRHEATRGSIRELSAANRWNVVFSRIKRGGRLMVALGDNALCLDDLALIVGPEEELQRATAFLGEEHGEHIEREDGDLEMRRIFVSSPAVEGRSLEDLRIDAAFGAVVTRLRRGDMDMVVRGDTVLAPGDRVRVVAPRARMKEINAFFGDSYRDVSQVDILTFSLGLALGLFLGILPLPFPGEITIRLGFAGGPLIMGLALGAWSRSGALVWEVPYAANMTLRQIGLLLFLAGIGTRAGSGLTSIIAQGGAWQLFVSGAAITFAVSFTALWAGYRWLKIPFGVLAGMVAGIHTQPAVLGFALDQTKNDLPNLGYASVFPTATALKILLAQILLLPT